MFANPCVHFKHSFSHDASCSVFWLSVTLYLPSVALPSFYPALGLLSSALTSQVGVVVWERVPCHGSRIRRFSTAWKSNSASFPRHGSKFPEKFHGMEGGFGVFPWHGSRFSMAWKFRFQTFLRGQSRLVFMSPGFPNIGRKFRWFFQGLEAVFGRGRGGVRRKNAGGRLTWRRKGLENEAGIGRIWRFRGIETGTSRILRET